MQKSYQIDTCSISKTLLSVNLSNLVLKNTYSKIFIQQLLKVVTVLFVMSQTPNDKYRIVKNVVTMKRSAFF